MTDPLKEGQPLCHQDPVINAALWTLLRPVLYPTNCQKKARNVLKEKARL